MASAYSLSSRFPPSLLGLLLLLLADVTCGDPVTANLPDILDAHNQRRSAHGSPALAWSDELQGMAQDWAAQLAEGCAIVHSQDGLGENLYQCYGAEAGCASGLNSAFSIDDPAAGWYESEKTWDLSAPSHITQLLWSSSQYVGCAVSLCDQQGFTSEIVVCKYEPAGNVMGQFEENVPPML
mmetsp:Transcript_10593/g.30172  ORF Transcript_10593/g.30172 Transcript_10593/m.30172 type:complete len:182 (-) Transcript_10593:80-625(-)